ncbi:MAG TPA: hypothetical protein VN578_02205 [Candidatus Binatia bacterium]|nr:hypothetical protein [Candidatus Binatia bacterium]
MNRSILIVICDFLLVSLLAFSSVDINKAVDDNAQKNVKLDLSIATNQPDSGKDLTAVMKLALDEERKSHDQLLGELVRTRQEAVKQQAMLSEREKQVQTVQQELQSREQQAQQLQQQQANLQQQFAAAQTNIQSLNQQLQGSSTEALMSKEKLAAMEAEMRKQMEQAAALQQQLAQLAKTNQIVLNEKQQLSTQLQVAEAEKRSATQLASRMQEEVKVEREEKAKLAEGVKALASNSGALAKEVRENRPMTPNTIFSEFSTNQVDARFDAVRPGLLGEASRHKETQTVLVSDGTNIFALCHVQDTPLSLGNPGTEWDGLTGTLSHNGASLPIGTIAFSWPDPRVVLIPVSPAQARELGSKVYRISPDPFKFQDAVLVGAREGYYGQCKFEMDLSTPEYLKLDRSFLKGLFGKFNPTRGDLVFSQQGELLGVMANGTYCLMLRSFDSVASFKFGNDVRAQHTGDMLSRLYAIVSGLPSKLQ